MFCEYKYIFPVNKRICYKEKNHQIDIVTLSCIYIIYTNVHVHLYYMPCWLIR